MDSSDYQLPALNTLKRRTFDSYWAHMASGVKPDEAFDRHTLARQGIFDLAVVRISEAHGTHQDFIIRQAQVLSHQPVITVESGLGA